MTEEWYERLREEGVLDTLAPYEPLVVGAYPLGIAPPDARVEIVCRASDLPAFARTVERAYGAHPGFALWGGRLDEEEAVFVELSLHGLPLEIAAQRAHVHRRLGAATVGLGRALSEQGPGGRARLAAAVAAGDDWLEAGGRQLNLSRTALESLAGANPALVRRVVGLPGPALALRTYALVFLLGLVAELLIVLALAARGSGDLVGALLILEGAVLGAVFGARLGLVAALGPLVLFGLVVGASILVGSEHCSGGCGEEIVGYLFLGLLVGSAAGICGALRDRYLPRAT